MEKPSWANPSPISCLRAFALRIRRRGEAIKLQLRKQRAFTQIRRRQPAVGGEDKVLNASRAHRGKSDRPPITRSALWQKIDLAQCILLASSNGFKL
jgi:hypothetical protein